MGVLHLTQCHKLQSLHPTQLSKLDSGIRKRTACHDSGSRPEAEREAKQLKLDAFRSGVLTQKSYEEVVENFVIGAMQPFSVVEHEDFLNMVTRLAPTKTPLTRRALMERIAARSDKTKQRLLDELGRAEHIAITADCWKSFNR